MSPRSRVPSHGGSGLASHRTNVVRRCIRKHRRDQERPQERPKPKENRKFRGAGDHHDGSMPLSSPAAPPTYLPPLLQLLAVTVDETDFWCVWEMSVENSATRNQRIGEQLTSLIEFKIENHCHSRGPLERGRGHPKPPREAEGGKKAAIAARSCRVEVWKRPNWVLGCRGSRC